MWPQANGEVERQNRSLLKTLKIAQAEKKNLKVEMRKFLTAYRTTPHSSTGVSPAKLLFNREIRSKIPELTKNEYIDSEARDRDAEMKQRRTDYADERRGAQENSLAPGDQVLVNKGRKTSCQPLSRMHLTRSPINMATKSQLHHLKELTTREM